MSFKDKAKITGLIVSLLLHALVILVLLLCAFKTPLPLPGEEGVEVMLGSADGGKGDDILFDRPAEKHKPASSAPDDDLVATSESEEEIYMPKADENKTQEKSENTETKNDSKDDTHEVAPTPKVNPNAIYKGSSGGNSSQSGSTGDGDGGSIFGSPNSTNTSGLGGSGDGISFSLGGRAHVSLPKPEYNSDEQGKIVVKIHVNKNGDVIKAEAGQRGTTIADNRLWKLTEAAALRSKFSPDAKANAIQIGTITYTFRRINE